MGAGWWRCASAATRPGLRLAWRGPDETGRPTVGSPIVAAGAVWDVDLDGRLFALDAATGAQRFQAKIPGQPGHFAALAYGGGQIYTATRRRRGRLPAGRAQYALNA